MKLLLPMILVVCTLTGCGSSDSSSSSVGASSSMGAQTETKKCAGCSTGVASADAVEKEGKTYCKACAEAH